MSNSFTPLNLAPKPQQTNVQPTTSSTQSPVTPQSPAPTNFVAHNSQSIISGFVLKTIITTVIALGILGGLIIGYKKLENEVKLPGFLNFLAKENKITNTGIKEKSKNSSQELTNNLIPTAKKDVNTLKTTPAAYPTSNYPSIAYSYDTTPKIDPTTGCMMQSGEYKKYTGLEEASKEQDPNTVCALILKDSKLTEIPQEVYRFKNLRQFSIVKNIYSLVTDEIKISGDIKKLSKLEELDLGSIPLLKQLPDEIGELTNLKKLVISYLSSLNSLNPNIGKLANLEELDLYNTKLDLPNEVANLPKLKKINMGYACSKNNINVIAKITSLTTVMCTRGSIGELTPEIGNLTNLEDLNLVDNQITKIPKEIGKLTKLKILFLSSNEFSEIPAEIGNLAELVSFKAEHNKITVIPPEIGRLTKLERLFLSENQISQIPAEIANLTDLATIDLSNNKITTIPPEIGKMSWLYYLYLNNNNIPQSEIDKIQKSLPKTKINDIIIVL